MNVLELKKIIKNLPDDIEVVLDDGGSQEFSSLRSAKVKKAIFEKQYGMANLNVEEELEPTQIKTEVLLLST